MAQQKDITINRLVGKIEGREIRLPEMQRRYVWSKNRVRDLLDSLYREYPTGTILTWEQRDPGQNIGSRDLPIERTDTNDRVGSELLLDGQQRLTSLSAILLDKPVYVKGRANPIEILFNLDHPDSVIDSAEVNEDEDENSEVDVFDISADNNMTFAVATPKLKNKPNWVSVSEVFKEDGDAPILKKAGMKDWDDPRFEKYTQRLQQLRGIKNYKYRVDTLGPDKSYAEVTDIFVRVNSLGTKLRSSDLALAQITAKWRGSLKIFEKFVERCKDKHGFDIDIAIYIKNLFAFTTGQPKFSDININNINQGMLQKGWEKSEGGMNFALNFLKSNVHINNALLLSSPFIIIVIAIYGHMKDYNLSPEEADQLRYWILLASIKGRYSYGSSETFLNQDLASLKRDKSIPNLLSLLIKAQAGRIEVESGDLENRNVNSPYFKTMFLVFKSKGAKDWCSQLVIDLKHQGKKHALESHHIFPRKVLEKKGVSKEKINDICNLAFISAQTNRLIGAKEPSIYFPEFFNEEKSNDAKLDKQGIPNNPKLNNTELDNQAIPTDPKLWQVSAYEDFLKKRRQLVADCLNKFLDHSRYPTK